LQRLFYEIECIRGNWSTRELERQIGSLYCQRSGLSRNKAKLAALVRVKAERADPHPTVRDPYVFEFLKIRPHIWAAWTLREFMIKDFILDDKRLKQGGRVVGKLRWAITGRTAAEIIYSSADASKIHMVQSSANLATGGGQFNLGTQCHSYRENRGAHSLTALQLASTMAA
jgi:hypothetical protein